MSMVTRCPSCNTVFRVTPQQLQVRQGKVRCGRCMMVFDGFGGLATLPETVAQDELHTPLQETAGTQDAMTRVPVTAPPPAAESPPAPAEFGPEPSMLPLPGPQADAAHALPSASFEASAQPIATDDGLFGGKAEPELRRSSWVWGLGSVFLLFALGGQAAYFYRSELAANYPGLKPVLVQMCSPLGCSVPLLQRPKLISVEASDLQVIDPARPNVIQLTATLRNHAGYDLAYPALDLVLTNSREHALARRIFTPGEYLERGKNVKSGIRANAEITIRLDLDTGNLGAAGFRLDLLPAPSN